MRYSQLARSQPALTGIILVFSVVFLLSACQPEATASPQSAPLTSPSPIAAELIPASPTPALSTANPEEPAASAAVQSQSNSTIASSTAASPTETSSASPTSSAEQPTQPAPTQAPSSTSPTAESTSSGSGPAASSSAACNDKAAFYGDVTIPDDTGFEQGVSFTKTWRFRNEGDCTWDETYTMVFSGGEILNGPLTAPLSTRVAPGEIANLSIDLRTPDRGGVFRSYWEFQNPQGARFGTGAGGHEPFWAQVVVSWTPPGGGSPGGGDNSGGNSGGGSSGAGGAGGNPAVTPTTPPSTPASGGTS